ncbi:siderophore-interacting protein [Halomonas sp. QX-2]|jgi:NADPH-dependent ferric siderophore reductase|uniref:Siderophore-interacting protein n=1 Tax=Vreelandella sedimenti TaxID=2729618 RepID=A0A7Z0N7T9_9GAMM|nr:MULTISPECIES: siderophore-interacting protein [Halomonas]NYT73245.1 siderophore-interacting protein [Halomonas sedimenti]|tara:strand:- start:10660 stop:11604 length:945 start_codon:yes stop_codon:yes gene_type:complete
MAAKPSYQLFDITLARRTQVSASLVRFTFTGPEVSQMATYAPDQRVKLFFPEGGGSLDPLFEIAKLEEHDWYGAYRALPDAQRPSARTYTIRALRPEQAEVDVEFVLHGDNGPASRWAMHARPGDRLAMTAPDASAEGPKLGYEWKPPQGVRRILIIADETALPAAAGILETLDDLPLKPRVEALFEVPRSDDAQSLPQATKLRWLARDAEPGCQHGELLMRALRDIDLHKEIQALGGTPTNTTTGATTNDESDDEDGPLWEPATLDDSAPFYAWIAAETKVAMKLRRYLVNECGLPKQYVTSMGYWRLGKANG